MKEIINDALQFAIKELEEFKSPHPEHLSIANEAGQKLAKELNADSDIVMLGTILMDCKIGQCMSEGRVQEHIDESYKAAKVFLDNYDISSEIKDKILNCVEAHHNTKLAKSLEAEIVANADCYRFLSPLGFFASAQLFGRRLDNLDDVIAKMEMKVEEKWNVLSLDICKKELQENYNSIKYLINNAKR